MKFTGSINDCKATAEVQIVTVPFRSVFVNYQAHVAFHFKDDRYGVKMALLPAQKSHEAAEAHARKCLEELMGFNNENSHA